MPQRITIPIVGQQAKSRSVSVNNQATVNFITSVKEPGAKAQIVLESAPGLVQLGGVGDGSCRTPQLVQWKHVDDKTLDTYGVFGSKVIRFKADNTTEELGSLNTSVGTCQIARGRSYLMIVDGEHGYSYDGTTLAEITDADFPDEDSSPVAQPSHCLYLDGFFIINDANSDNFYISAIENPTSWNALDFEAASVAPDNALAIAASTSILYIMGDQTTQLYYNSGNILFPYTLITSATQEVGILAPHSLADSDDGLFFLATTPQGGRFVYQMRGQDGRRITMDEQENQLADITDANIKAAYGFIYKQAGKSFYVLQFGQDDVTLVYNINGGVWESRARFDGRAYRLAGAGILNGLNIGGSRYDSRYYRIDLKAFKDDDDPLVRRRVTQIYHLNNQRMDWWELVIDIEPGVGLATGTGTDTDPELRLRYSNDDGRTWSADLVQKPGKIGEYENRCVFRNLGASRKRIYEIEVSEPVNITIIAAYAHVEVLDD